MQMQPTTDVLHQNAAKAALSPREIIINEEYKIWKKNSPFLYDMILTHSLEWPSLTVQWLPEKQMHRDKNIDYTTQKLILGTHTQQGDQNHLMIANVKMPKASETNEEAGARQDDSFVGGYGAATGKFSIWQKINHEGEVNRARYMPQNPNLIATKSSSNFVNIFDRSKHPTTPADNVTKSDLKLGGHTQQGFGLSWNVRREGLLASGSKDGLVCIWDVERAKRTDDILQPVRTLVGHTASVEDVAWHRYQSHTLASVDTDRAVYLWDTRNPLKPSQIIFKAHRAEVNSVDFNPFSEHLFATGSSDRTAGLWDLRCVSQKLHSFENHVDEVFSVKWGRFEGGNILATAGADRRVNVWDLSLIGLEQTTEDASDGPPELLFIHGGHTDNVGDLDWSPNEPWVMASVSDNNIVQIWQMAELVHADGDPTEEISAKDLE